MRCGQTFLLYDDDESGSIPHLHIVITDPDQSGRIVLVSVTTERGRSDTMTRLAAHEHPFIDRPSVITYAYSKLMECVQIDALVKCGDAKAKEDALPTLVRRAQAGMVETDRAPQEVKEFFLEWWGNRGTE